VFVNQPADYVKGVAALVHLGAVQLHGDEDCAYAASIGWPIIKAVAIGKESTRADIDRWPVNTMLLLDARDPVNRGGTGRTIDWTIARSIAFGRRALLAGGLTPDNVAAAVAAVQPFGIDVSSGVEQSPGVKDHARIRALFEALRSTAEYDSLRSNTRTK
jgi:phosphoribosylanthranilate isomerase